MKNQITRKRMRSSAIDFARGVQPALESRLNCKISSIEEFESNELVKKLDQTEIDSFRCASQGGTSALASRMNYHRALATRPMFSFRYALWNAKFKAWDCDREYIRKLLISRQSDTFKLFPLMHVESFCHGRNTAKIGWSFAASTKEILEFAEQNIENSEAVQIVQPKGEEPSKLIKVSIAAFAKAHQVLEIRAA